MTAIVMLSCITIRGVIQQNWQNLNQDKNLIEQLEGPIFIDARGFPYNALLQAFLIHFLFTKMHSHAQVARIGVSNTPVKMHC